MVLKMISTSPSCVSSTMGMNNWGNDSSTRTRGSFHKEHKKTRRRSLVKEGHNTHATKKTVSFCTMVSVRAALHIDNYREEEIRATWYTPEEALQSQREVKRLVKKLNRGETVEESNRSSARGLDCRTRAGARKRFLSRAKAKLAVCQEQERRWAQGTAQDPELLAMLYFAASNQSQIEATDQGLEDELDALPQLPGVYL